MSSSLYDYVDLHHHSHYSVLDALPTPEEVIAKAVELNRPAVALTDHGSVAGHVLLEKAVEGIRQGTGFSDAHVTFHTGQTLDIKPIYGVEAYLVENVGHRVRHKNHVTLLAKDQAGYRNILQLVTRSYDEGFYYRPSVDFQMLHDHREGVLCLSGCESGMLFEFIKQQRWGDAGTYLQVLGQIYGEDAYVELQHFPHSAELQFAAYQAAQQLGLKHVVTCDVHYLEPLDQEAHQLIMAVRDRCSYGDAFKLNYAMPWAPDGLLHGLEQLQPGVDWRRAFDHVAEVNAKISSYQLPKAPFVTFPLQGDKRAYVRELCQQFLRNQGLANDQYLDRLDHELNVVADKGYLDYFLVVADIINWAKAQGIMVGPGRGSAAGSVVCWGLGITTVDPIRWGLMFERFVDPTRTDLPDIDIDFEDDRRGEVISYIRQKYGEENTALISTFAHFGGKQTLWDAARVFNIPDAAVKTVIRYLPQRSSGDQRAGLTVQDALDEPEVQAVYARHPELQLASAIQGKIRHRGKHAAGVVVASEPITNYAAVYKVPASGERLVELDWRDAAYLNLMKIDILGLKECTMLRRMGEAVGMTLQQIYDIPLDDPAAIQIFNDRDFLGIFQYDGQAVRSVANQIYFESLEQVAAVNALARPGPLWSQATAGYIRGRRDGLPHYVIEYEPVQRMLARTYGQIIYQESVMQILREIGGMTWQEVTEVRAIMGKSKGSEAFHNYYPSWEAGCRERGVPEHHIQQIWGAIRTYGRHAFNISHAFVYGLLAYWGAWFKAHYPVEFYWAHLLKAADRLELERYLVEARRRGVPFGTLELDTQETDWHIRAGAITPGWSVVPGIGPAAAERLAAGAPYDSAKDLQKRTAGIGPKKREDIEGYLGASMGEIFDLDLWDRLTGRTPIQTVAQEDNERWQGRIAGRVIKINKKSRIEEATSRGKPLPDDGGPDEYASITVLDDTGSIVCWISNLVYQERYDTIWASDGELVWVTGRRSKGLPLVVVEDVELLQAS